MSNTGAPLPRRGGGRGTKLRSGVPKVTFTGSLGRLGRSQCSCDSPQFPAATVFPPTSLLVCLDQDVLGRRGRKRRVGRREVAFGEDML